MNPLAIASVVFACSFAAALVGMALHVRLPDYHLEENSRDVVKLVMGLVATMAALVLSLLIASANTSHELQNTGLEALAVNIVVLDRTLGSYGPGAKAVREGLRDQIRSTHARIWSPEGVHPEDLNSEATRRSARANLALVLSLAPSTEVERILQSRAIQQFDELSRARLLMFEQLGGSMSWPFLTVLIFWISVLFLGFGLLARSNATVTATLFVGALSVAGAIFLLLELDDPYHGIMRISDEPLRNALTQIDQ